MKNYYTHYTAALLAAALAALVSLQQQPPTRPATVSPGHVPTPAEQAAAARVRAFASGESNHLDEQDLQSPCVSADLRRAALERNN